MHLVAHPSTQKNISSFLDNPSHGLLIIGAHGSGKSYVAKYITTNLIDKSENELENYPYFKSIAPKKDKSFGIDDIREIKKFMQLKTTGDHNLRRFVLINDAHELGHEAQNAMLKFLEEPPQDTCIILTTSNPDKLKPTILSRLRTLRVRNIPKSQLAEVVDDQSDIDRLYALSEGAIAELMRLNEASDTDDASIYLQDAKDLVRDSRQDRLARLDKFVKNDNYNLALLLDSLYKIVDMKFKLVSKKSSDMRSVRVLYTKLNQIQYARKMLSQNVQPKLVLTKLFYEL